MKQLPKRVALYARVSTRDKGQEVKNQLIELREFCQRQGWTIIHEYVDHATGKHSHREQFQKLFLDASQRRFDVLLFWALDRFTREGMRATINHLERLTASGVIWRSYKEPHLDTTNEMVRDILLAVLSSMAKQEHLRISERTIAGLERARQEGKQLGRPRKRLTPEQIRQVRKLRKTQSWTTIAQKLGVRRATLYKYCREMKEAA